MVARLRVVSRPFYWWIGVLLGLILFGSYGAIATLLPGQEVFGTSPLFQWGLLIATYIFFVVSSTGLCLVSSLGHVFGMEQYKPLGKRAVVLAIVTLVSGFGVIGLDLQHPERLVLGVVFSPSPRSAMWWMGVLYSLYLVFLLIELRGLLTEDSRLARIGGSLAFVTAISAHSTLGAVFGFMISRPYWYGAYLPIYFILSALVSGAALLGIVFFLVDFLGLQGSSSETKGLSRNIGSLLALFLGIEVFFTVWQTITGLYGRVPGQYEATVALVAGPLSVQFWALRVLVGLLLPFALLVIPATKSRAGVFWASVLSLIGILADRIELLEAGQIIPPSAASGLVAFPYAHYSASLAEISIAVGAIAFAALAFTLAERHLPLAEGAKAGHLAMAEELMAVETMLRHGEEAGT